MRIIAELALAAALFAAMGMLWRASGRVCFTPVPKSPDAETYIIIAAAGAAAGLEQTVGSISWLNETVAMNGRIIIADRGLNGEGRRIADILARDGRNVFICPAEDVSKEFLRVSE